jgi:hypothetical protein
MQYYNTFHPVQNLLRTAINPGGLCWVLFFNIQDVAAWPEVDPATGVINADILLKPGSSFYTLQTSEKGRIFKEALKYTNAGPLVDTEVAGTVCGNNLNHITSVAAMQHNRFGVLIRERNGEQRLIGNPDAGAVFSYDYTSGDIFSSRTRGVKFNFSAPGPCPIYQSGNIILDTTVIPIGGSTGGTGGGTTGSTLQLVAKFEVGKAGAPMANGDTTFTNAGIATKNVMVFADGLFLPEVDNPFKRYIIKAPGSQQITFVGGVMQGEAISIFSF